MVLFWQENSSNSHLFEKPGSLYFLKYSFCHVTDTQLSCDYFNHNKKEFESDNFENLHSKKRDTQTRNIIKSINYHDKPNDGFN